MLGIVAIKLCSVKTASTVFKFKDLLFEMAHHCWGN